MDSFKDFKLNENFFNKEELFLKIKNNILSNTKIMDYLLSHKYILKEVYEKFGNKSYNSIYNELSILNEENAYQNVKNFIKKISKRKKFTQELYWFVVAISTFLGKNIFFGSVTISFFVSSIACFFLFLVVIYKYYNFQRNRMHKNTTSWFKFKIDDYITINGNYKLQTTDQTIHFENIHARILTISENDIFFDSAPFSSMRYDKGIIMNVKFLDDFKFNELMINPIYFKGEIKLLDEELNEVYKDLELFD